MPEFSWRQWKVTCKCKMHLYTWCTYICITLTQLHGHKNKFVQLIISANKTLQNYHKLNGMRRVSGFTPFAEASMYDRKQSRMPVATTHLPVPPGIATWHCHLALPQLLTPKAYDWPNQARPGTNELRVSMAGNRSRKDIVGFLTYRIIVSLEVHCVQVSQSQRLLVNDYLIIYAAGKTFPRNINQ